VVFFCWTHIVDAGSAATSWFVGVAGARVFAHDPQKCCELFGVGRAIARFALGFNRGADHRYGFGLTTMRDQQAPMSA